MLSLGIFIYTSLTRHYNIAIDIPVCGDQISPFIFVKVQVGGDAGFSLCGG